MHSYAMFNCIYFHKWTLHDIYIYTHTLQRVIAWVIIGIVVNMCDVTRLFSYIPKWLRIMNSFCFCFFCSWVHFDKWNFGPVRGQDVSWSIFNDIPKSLEILQLENCQLITDNDLAKLSGSSTEKKITGLTDLTIVWCENITGSTFDKLPNSLRCLKLPHPQRMLNCKSKV
jgi:hypothetical protein